MKMKRTTLLFTVSAALMLLFVLFTAAIANFDVRAIGPLQTSVGFASANEFFRDIIGVNDGWYKLSEALGFFTIAVMLLFAAIGGIQLVTRKSLKAVDSEILALGVFYVIVIIFYLLFDALAVNYRPILIDGQIEASYPSSHSMLAVCVMLTALLPLKKRLPEKAMPAVKVICIAVAVLTVIGRLLSGVHWFTDIIGGVILSCSLSVLCYALAEKFRTLLKR